MYQTSLLITIIFVLVVQDALLFWEEKKTRKRHIQFWVKMLTVIWLLGTVVLLPPSQLDLTDPKYTYIRVQTKFESKHLYYEEFLTNYDMRE